MKYYIEEDELWPVISVKPETDADDYMKKYYTLVDLPDHLVSRYEQAYTDFMEMRAVIMELIDEQEKKA